MSEFVKGDLVVLKSGGPKMTVADLGDFSPVGPTDGVRCVWFEGQLTKRKMEEVFDAAFLEHVSGSGGLRTSRV